MIPYELEIIAHAEAEHPRECCGLLFKGAEKGATIVKRCKNLAVPSEHDFEIDPGEIYGPKVTEPPLAIYHSHTFDSSQISEADKRSCEICKIPFLVYSTSDKLFSRYDPTGYAVPLVGREFVLGIFDCCTLVIDYYKQKGILEMPYFMHDLSSMTVGHANFRNYLGLLGFFEVEDRDNLFTHDIITMAQSGYGYANHAGVYVGNNEMLHQMLSRSSAITPYRGTFWEKTTVGVYRYAK